MFLRKYTVRCGKEHTYLELNHVTADVGSYPTSGHLTGLEIA